MPIDHTALPALTNLPPLATEGRIYLAQIRAYAAYERAFAHLKEFDTIDSKIDLGGYLDPINAECILINEIVEQRDFGLRAVIRVEHAAGNAELMSFHITGAIEEYGI